MGKESGSLLVIKMVNVMGIAIVRDGIVARKVAERNDGDEGETEGDDGATDVDDEG